MTLPELFAVQYERTNGNLMECFRVVLEADAMLKRRPLLKMRAVDDEWIDAKARAIAGAIALNAGLTFRDLSGPARITRVSRVRHDAMLAVRELTGMSYPAIGAMFGHRDHATVINGCKRAQQRFNERPDTWETLRTIAVEAMGDEQEGKVAA